MGKQEAFSPWEPGYGRASSREIPIFAYRASLCVSYARHSLVFSAQEHELLLWFMW